MKGKQDKGMGRFTRQVIDYQGLVRAYSESQRTNQKESKEKKDPEPEKKRYNFKTKGRIQG